MKPGCWDESIWVFETICEETITDKEKIQKLLNKIKKFRSYNNPSSIKKMEELILLVQLKFDLSRDLINLLTTP